MAAPDRSNFHVLTYECHDMGIKNVGLAVSKRFFNLPHLYSVVVLHMLGTEFHWISYRYNICFL